MFVRLAPCASVTVNVNLPSALVTTVEVKRATLPPINVMLPLVAAETVYMGVLFVKPRVNTLRSMSSGVPLERFHK